MYVYKYDKIKKKILPKRIWFM